jgi:hypothetical protein
MRSQYHAHNGTTVVPRNQTHDDNPQHQLSPGVDQSLNGHHPDPELDEIGQHHPDPELDEIAPQWDSEPEEIGSGSAGLPHERVELGEHKDNRELLEEDFQDDNEIWHPTDDIAGFDALLYDRSVGPSTSSGVASYLMLLLQVTLQLPFSLFDHCTPFKCLFCHTDQ